MPRSGGSLANDRCRPPGDRRLQTAAGSPCHVKRTAGAAAEGPDPRRAFLVQAHLGNYALWMSGRFPDRIERRRWRRGGPDLDYFEQLGRRGFQLAARHRLADEHGLALLFALAAERFPVVRIALNRISDALLFPNQHSPDRLMRQVRDEARWRHSH